VCGGIDWHFRQNRSRNLSHELAASGRRVFYVTPELIDDDHPGFEFEQLDETSRLFQIRFHGQGGTLSSHTSPPNGELVSQLRIGLGEMLEWAGTTEIVSIVQHPSWFDAVRVLPNSRLVYDCIDHFGRVGNPGEALLNLEKTLLRQADLTITSLTYLDQFVAPFAARRAVIKNGCQFEHFASAPAGIFRDSTRRKVIGYFGAITEWFDQDLVAAIAKRFPETLLLLIGNDKVNAGYRLGVLPNVRMIGEVPYKDLPYFVHGFDVSILPLKIEPLTLATNQVNVYEYLSIGKPVVAVDLPEMAEFADLVNVARDPDKFLSNIANLLSKPVDRQAIRRRRQFAQTQTWSNRANCLISEIERLDAQPLVSVIVVTYNNLQLTRTCLASLDEQSAGLPLELIVVDNQSTDGSREFLSEWSKQASNRRLIINEDNRGFAAANNQGLAVAGGDYLVLLNNDTHVTPGWARTLVTHLRQDESIGLIGPVTNNIGNEAKIDITYDNMNEMLTAAASYTRKHVGMLTPLRTAAFFCVMFSRNTYQHVGILDENFGRGFFEDDDYCRRVEQYGRRIVCAEDVFVHHQLSASFNKLFQPERIELFERNKAYYESKWGKWIPHQAR
jgi:GT2 family glycosyltransferase/glycosyltransferase involved in cell wall biosynthesis